MICDALKGCASIDIPAVRHAGLQSQTSSTYTAC